MLSAASEEQTASESIPCVSRNRQKTCRHAFEPQTVSDGRTRIELIQRLFRSIMEQFDSTSAGFLAVSSGVNNKSTPRTQCARRLAPGSSWS